MSKLLKFLLIKLKRGPISKLEFQVNSLKLKREILQKRNSEKWTISMLSEYYECSENEIRNVLDSYQIK